MNLGPQLALYGTIALALIVIVVVYGFWRDARLNRQADAEIAAVYGSSTIGTLSTRPAARPLPGLPVGAVRPRQTVTAVVHQPQPSPSPEPAPAPTARPSKLEQWLQFDELSWQAAKMAQDAQTIAAAYETMSGAIVARCQWAQAKLGVTATDLVEAAAAAILSQTHGDWNAHRALVAAS